MIEIGKLRASLSLSSAAFEKGLKRAQAAMGKTQKSFSVAGTIMSRAGRSLSAATATTFAGVSIAAVQAANSLNDLGNQARVAGVTAQEFKVISLATKSLGVEQDKLSDILKDVNDKFGDYAQTGAGPLVDFFEQIAPKVGVTKEAFEGLSSSDALQLYVSSLEKANVSQAEMTFYMEALSSDATLLLPAFQNGGQAIDDMRIKAERFGLTLDDKAIAAAARAREEFSIVSDVLKTKLSAAFVEVLPAITKMIEAFAPMASTLAGYVSRAAEAFASLSPKMQGVAIAGAGLAAALGPALMVLGAMAAGVAALASPVVVAVGALAALAAGVTYAVRNWDDLVARFPALGAVADVVKGQIDAITGVVAGMVDTVKALFKGDFKGAWESVGGIIESAGKLWPLSVGVALTKVASFAFDLAVDIGKGIVAKIGEKWGEIEKTVAELGGKLVSALKALPVQIADAAIQIGKEIVVEIAKGLEDIWPALKEFGDNIVQGIKDIPSRVADWARRLGRDIVAGVTGGIQEKEGEARGAAHMLGMGTVEAMKDSVQSRSPSRAFWQIGSDIVAGLSIGIDDNSEKALDAIRDLTDRMLEHGKFAAQGLVDVFTDGLGKLATGQISIGGIFDGLKRQALGGLSNIVSGAIGDAMKTGGGLGGIWSGITGNISGAVSKIGGAIGGIFPKLGGAISGLAGIAGTAIPVLGAVGAAFSFFKKKTTILDQGIRLTIGSMDDLEKRFKWAGGRDGYRAAFDALDGRDFGAILEESTKTKKTSFGGLFSSTGTVHRAADAGPLIADIDALRSGVEAAAASLGVAGADWEGFTSQIKFSTKGLTDEQAQAKIAEAFGGFTDAMTRHLTPGLDALARDGEGAGDTLNRLATSLTVVDAGLGTMGQSLGAITSGLAGVTDEMARADVASKIGDLFGGPDGFGAAVTDWNGRFRTEAERLAQVGDQINSAFADLGMAVPESRAAYVDLVRSLDLTKAGAREAFAALVGLGPLMDEQFSTLETAAAASAQLMAGFQSEFFTAAQQAELAAASLSGALMSLGISAIPATKAAFADLVMGAQGAMQEALLRLSGDAAEYYKMQERMADEAAREAERAAPKISTSSSYSSPSVVSERREFDPSRFANFASYSKAMVTGKTEDQRLAERQRTQTNATLREVKKLLEDIRMANQMTAARVK